MKRLNLLFALFFLRHLGFSQPAAPAQLIPLDPAIRTGKLSNGFIYYIRRNTSPANRVVLYLANKAGSILETEDQRGLAHFMEHMSFNGTAHFHKNQLVNYLQKIGVSFGADLNAYTGFDETVYQLPLPSGDPEILKNGIQIIRDWAGEADLDPEEIDKERGVVLEEKRLHLGAGQRVQNQFQNLMFNASRYSERIPIGTEEVIKNFRPETLRAYYKDWYRPDLQAIIVVGNVNVDEIEKMVKTKFSDLKNPAEEKERTIYSIPLTGKNHFKAVTDPELTTTEVQVIIKSRFQPLKTIGDYRKSMVRSLYNQLLAKRLSEASLRPEAAFSRANAGVSDFMGGITDFTVSITPKPGKPAFEDAFKSVWRELISIKKNGFTAGELTVAKHSYLNLMENAFKEKDKTPSDDYVKEYVRNFTQGEPAPGIAFETEIVKKELPGISLDEINACTAIYLKDTDRDILISAPEKEKQFLPREQTMNDWIREIDSENFQPRSEEAHQTSLLSRLPAGGKVIAESKDEALQVTTLTLSNGVKVILKPTSFRDNEILFSGFSAGGTSVYKKEDYISAANAVPMLTSFGIGNYPMAELRYFLSDKQLSVQPFISERIQGVNAVTVPNDLETALQLTYAYFTAPRKDTAAFRRTMARIRENIATRYNDPDNVFRDTIAAVMGNYDFRRIAPSLDQVNQIKLDRLYDIYKERFACTADLTFTFVGSFNTDSIKPLLALYLGALPTAKAVTKANDTGIRVPKGKIAKTVYKGTEQKANVQLIFSGTFSYSMENSLDLEALKRALEIRMIERLREDEGGVYSPSVRLKVSRLPEADYAIGVSFACSPANVDKLINDVMDEINVLKTVGPPQANVDKLVATERVRYKNTRETNGWWIGYLNSCIETGDSFSITNEYPKLLDKVSVAGVKEAAQRYLSGNDCLRFVLLPADKI